MISSIWWHHSRGLEYCSSDDIDARQPSVYMTIGHSLYCCCWPGRCPLAYMLWRCCCIINVTLLSRVTLIRKLQSTSDLDHFHARDLSCSHVKSCDDSISNCRVHNAVPHSFVSKRKLTFTFTICYRPSVCLSSVTLVRPTQAVEIFGNISMAFGTLVICWHP